MTQIAYIDGKFTPTLHAKVDFNDRGYHFADGIYEVMAFYHQRFIDYAPHMERLHRSLDEMGIPAPMGDAGLVNIMRELMRRNAMRHGLIYLQITRGVTPRRNHLAPKRMRPVLTLCALPENKAAYNQANTGVKVITAPDERWSRCNIKSISLLPNTLAKRTAADAHAYETWQIRDGIITEGSASNSYIITDEGALKTHPSNAHILGGIVRETTLRLAHEAGIDVDETPFTPEEALAASEAFLTSSSAHILPVTHIDGATIGNGQRGQITQKLQRLYHDHIAKETGYELT